MEGVYESAQCRDIHDPTGPQTHNQNQIEGRVQKHRKCRCVVLVILGFICALLLLFITLQHISITAERDLLKTYKNTVEELNHTISSLQHNNTDLETDKHQLEDKYNSLSLEKHQLETRVDDLNAQKNQLQNNVNSLNQKLLELENRIVALIDDQKDCSIEVLFFTEAKSWSDSRQFCRDHGADLVIIKSEVKQRNIFSFVKERMWIGLSDIQTEGTMMWVDNSLLNQGFWLKGEPNNNAGNEDCVELLPTKPVLNNWNDVPCSEKRRGVCEK